MTGQQLPNQNTRDPRLLLQDWPEALIALDEHKCISVISCGAKQILGEEENVYIGKHVHDALCVNTRSFAHDISNCPVCKRFNEYDQKKVTSTWWKNTHGNNVSLDYHVLHPGNLGDIKYLISFVDNRERNYNQEELEKYAEYIDKSPSPFAELDADATIVFANSAMNKKLIEHGFSGTGNANIFPVNIKDLCYRCLHEKSRLECVEVTIDKHTYSWNFYPLESTKNSVLAWLNDVSEKKKIEETLKSEQSAARRDFYAKMVHELRTPINAIVGFSNILLVGDTQKYTAEELDMLERIYNGGLELSDLISDTLDASKIAAGKMDLSISQFNLSEVLNQLHSQIEGMASIKSLKLIANCSNSLEIRSDKNKVKQILSNLISNAIKYTDEGAITVLVLEPQNRSIEIQISDTGIGLKEDERIKVFENYQRAGEPNLQEIQGTGIGLALVKELVTMLNGEIDVSSTYGKGSTFTVYLPYSID